MQEVNKESEIVPECHQLVGALRALSPEAHSHNLAAGWVIHSADSMAEKLALESLVEIAAVVAVVAVVAAVAAVAAAVAAAAAVAGLDRPAPEHGM